MLHMFVSNVSSVIFELPDFHNPSVFIIKTLRKKKRINKPGILLLTTMDPKHAGVFYDIDLINVHLTCMEKTI